MIVLYGAHYSVYTRIVRLVLEEKAQTFSMIEVDVFGRDRGDGLHQLRHPFARVPVLEHDGLSLFETSAIARYLDDVFSPGALQPETIVARARMNQIISIMDGYAFRGMVWDVFVERVRKPVQGVAPDEAKIAAGLATGHTVLATLSRLQGKQTFLAGDRISLADLWALPMITLFVQAPEGRALLATYPDLLQWFDAMTARPSAVATRFQIEDS